MARLALIHGRDSVVRQIAEEIIASQTVEIAAMLGRMAGSGSILQAQVPNHPNSRRSSITRLALLMVKAICVPICRQPAPPEYLTAGSRLLTYSQQSRTVGWFFDCAAVGLRIVGLEKLSADY